MFQPQAVTSLSFFSAAVAQAEVGAVLQGHSKHESKVWPHSLLLSQFSQSVLTPNWSESESFLQDDLVGHMMMCCAE